FGRHCTNGARLTKDNLNVFDALEFSCTALEQCFRIVRLDPVLEELDGNAHADGLAVEMLELHRLEPAGVDIVTKLGTEHLPNLLPAHLLRRGCGAFGANGGLGLGSTLRLAPVAHDMRGRSRGLQTVH